MDWSQPARAAWNRVRAMTPWPGAFTHLQDKSHPYLLKIWEARPDPQSGAPGRVLSADRNGIVAGCGVESLRILEVQREGGRRMGAGEFLAGHAIQPGQKFQ